MKWKGKKGFDANRIVVGFPVLNRSDARHVFISNQVEDQGRRLETTFTCSTIFDLLIFSILKPFFIHNLKIKTIKLLNRDPDIIYIFFEAASRYVNANGQAKKIDHHYVIKI